MPTPVDSLSHVGVIQALMDLAGRRAAGRDRHLLTRAADVIEYLRHDGEELRRHLDEVKTALDRRVHQLEQLDRELSIRKQLGQVVAEHARHARTEAVRAAVELHGESGGGELQLTSVMKTVVRIEEYIRTGQTGLE